MGSPLDILYLEDNLRFVEAVVPTFLSDHVVHHVTTVNEAAAAWRVSGPFDVVLVDYDLEEEKGDALVRILRGAGARVPIIATSARELGNERLVAAGADAVCSKVEFSRILAQIRECSSRGV